MTGRNELPPGSTIGIIGGGQLGRMMALAAARLGYQCHIFDPHERPCAAEVSRPISPAPHSTMARRCGASPGSATSSPMSSRISRSSRLPCSATSCAPARAAWRSPRTGRSRSASSKACGARVAPWRDGRRRRRHRRRARRARLADRLEDAAASAMTARARPGSIAPSEAADGLGRDRPPAGRRRGEDRVSTPNSA